jgi:hypothetical protein
MLEKSCHSMLIPFSGKLPWIFRQTPSMHFQAEASINGRSSGKDGMGVFTGHGEALHRSTTHALRHERGPHSSTRSNILAAKSELPLAMDCYSFVPNCAAFDASADLMATTTVVNPCPVSSYLLRRFGLETMRVPRLLEHRHQLRREVERSSAEPRPRWSVPCRSPAR